MSTGTPPAEVTATHYAVSCLPLDHMQRAAFTLTVEYRGDGTWAVLDSGWCVGRRGQRRYEPIPSMRTERFKRAYRFDLDTALTIARREAPKLTSNGLSVADALARIGAAPTPWWDEFEAEAKKVGCLLSASWWADYETESEAAAALADHLERHLAGLS